MMRKNFRLRILFTCLVSKYEPTNCNFKRPPCQTAMTDTPRFCIIISHHNDLSDDSAAMTGLMAKVVS